MNLFFHVDYTYFSCYPHAAYDYYLRNRAYLDRLSGDTITEIERWLPYYYKGTPD